VGRDGRYATRWVRRGGHYALERTLRREPPPWQRPVPVSPRPTCPLRMILYAVATPFMFGALGYLAYLLR